MSEANVALGSKNPAKLKAVETAFLHYFDKVNVRGFDVESGVHRQPKSIEEMVKGASNRAKNCFALAKNADFGVGIESGLIQVPGFSFKYLTGGLSAIFDGEHVHIGISPCFELPEKLVRKVFDENSEVGVVFDDLLKRKNVKQHEGAVGVLTKQKFKRSDMLALGVALALVPIVSSEWFQNE